MINRRLALGLIATATTIGTSRIAFAKEKHHLNGKDLLGEKIKKNGKHKMAIIGAVMRKLIHLAYGVLKNQKPFDPHYGNAVWPAT